jgi:hypothetical protein
MPNQFADVFLFVDALNRPAMLDGRSVHSFVDPTARVQFGRLAMDGGMNASAKSLMFAMA